MKITFDAAASDDLDRIFRRDRQGEAGGVTHKLTPAGLTLRGFFVRFGYQAKPSE
jgi:hypothetical protein